MQKHLLLLIIGVCFSVPCAMADDNFIDEHINPTSLQVDRVEEDWELIVSQPDPNVTGPQITTAFAPNGHTGGIHAILNLNHFTLNEFQPGGVQLQVWYGESPVTHKSTSSQTVLSQSNETITWTQVMELQDSGQLTFRIKDGNSSAWGNFGNGGSLTATVGTSLQNLNPYNPVASLTNSGVFAANRVTRLRLKKIIIHTTDGSQFDVTLNHDVVSN